MGSISVWNFGFFWRNNLRIYFIYICVVHSAVKEYMGKSRKDKLGRNLDLTLVPLSILEVLSAPNSKNKLKDQEGFQFFVAAALLNFW